MSEKKAIPRGSAVVLDYDHDFTYFTHADTELDVMCLAAGITETGIVAAIARPLRVRKMNQLVEVEINPGAGEGEGMCEIINPLTIRQLAETLTAVNTNNVELQG